MTSIDVNRQNCEKEYANAKLNFDEKKLTENIQANMSTKKELKNKLSQIDSEINTLIQLNQMRNQKEFNQKQLQKKEKIITCIREKHSDKLQSIFNGREIPPKNLKFELEQIQTSLVNIILLLHHLERLILLIKLRFTFF